MISLLFGSTVRAYGEWPDNDEEGQQLSDAIEEAIGAGIAAAQSRLNERLGEGRVRLEVAP